MIKTYKDIEIKKEEIYRYMKTKETNEISHLVDDCLKECKDILSFSVAFDEFDISVADDEIDLSFAKIKSKSLSKFLGDSNKIVVFVATIGLGIDRLINKYSKTSQSRALSISAIGTVYIEALCDKFNFEISENNKRFSPGYGDLELSVQKEIFKVLDTNKIGVTLNDNLLMSPVKSVSAIIVRN